MSSENISKKNINEKKIEDLYAKVIPRNKRINTSPEEIIPMIETKKSEILNEKTNCNQLNTIHQDYQSNEMITENSKTRFTDRNICLKWINNLKFPHTIFFIFAYAVLTLFFVTNYLVFKKFVFSVAYLVLFCILFLVNILYLFKRTRPLAISLFEIFVSILNLVHAVFLMFLYIENIHKQ